MDDTASWLQKSEKLFEKIKLPQRKGMWFVTNEMDLHLTKQDSQTWVIRLHSTDWNSSLQIQGASYHYHLFHTKITILCT